MSDSPSWLEVLEDMASDQSTDLHCVKIGKVVTPWDKDEQTANIEIQVNPPNGKEYPVIEKVKVVFPGAYWDVQVGEYGLVLIGDWDLNRWWRTEEKTTPESVTPHAIGNATFLPGIRTRAGSRTIDTGTLVLEKPTPTGEVQLGVQGATKAVLHEDLTTPLNNFLTALSTWAGTVDGAIPIPALNTFATVVQGFLDTLSTAVYKSPSVKVED